MAEENNNNMEVDSPAVSNCNNDAQSSKGKVIVATAEENNNNMEVGSLAESNCNNDSQSSKEMVIVASGIPASSSGYGQPYAPDAWPGPGDIWRWRVGNRQTKGYWKDRSLFAPEHLLRTEASRRGFHSKVSLEEYIRTYFPEKDLDAFFASFTWRVPANNSLPVEVNSCNNTKRRRLYSLYSNGRSKSVPNLKLKKCKAGNMMCINNMKETKYSAKPMPCNICCTEVGFCRECTCILCIQAIDWELGGFSFIKCEAKVDDSYMCGHVAHFKCALGCNLAGTIGGNIGLDAEYYCRLCDSRTDLLSHVSKLIESCKSLGSRDDIEKILNFSLSIIGDSKQEKAKDLINQISVFMDKIKRGVYLGDVWTTEDDTPKDTGDVINFPTRKEEDLDAEINRALEKLKKSQESEFALAECKLYAQKDSLISLYQLPDVETSELQDESYKADRIMNEEAKLQKMMMIANGVGKTPKTVLTEFFGSHIED